MTDFPPDDLSFLDEPPWMQEAELSLFPPELFDEPPDMLDAPPLDLSDLPTGDYADVAFLFDDNWDLPADDLLDTLFDEAIAQVGLEDTPALSLDDSLAAIGLRTTSSVPLDLQSPPLVHPESGAQVWFGVLVPDTDDSGQGVMGILSAHENEVAFAPCVMGDFEQCFQQAESLTTLAETQGLDTALGQALDLAIDSQQLLSWQHEWGTPLPENPSQQVRDFLSDLEL